ncbi:4-hydroxy-tetrahydrodipicolinate synthase [plant metagenome]|uniref:4-hydroxy-tetrahydrodipicolinate synthase n=1 Tax=plant metagenome TaxID=1297885 RepID=A0A484UMI7_9ZZZZ
MSVAIPGLVVPPLTPFDANQRVDAEALRRQVDYVVQDCDASMVVAAGVEAQEYTYLTLEERRALIRQTVDFVDGRTPVAVGISHPSFKIAVELATLAADLGAHAVQLLAPLRPFGGPPTQRELLAYVQAIARETPLPIMLYLNAGPGADVSVEGTIELAQLDSVKYLKESSRDLSRVGRLIHEIDRAGHARYFTTLQMLLATLELGGSGITTPPPAAALARRVIAAHLAGDAAEARRLQGQFALYPARWMKHGLMPTMKASLKLLGVPAGDPYPPFPPIAGEELQALADYLETTDLTAKEAKHA